MELEVRWGEGKLDRLPALAAELVRLKVDVIVAALPRIDEQIRQDAEQGWPHVQTGGPGQGKQAVEARHLLVEHHALGVSFRPKPAEKPGFHRPFYPNSEPLNGLLTLPTR